MPTENKIAAPEESAGVDFGIDGRSVRVSQEAYSIFLAREAAGREKIAALQQRLTAADERADVLGLDAARYRWLRDPDNQEDLEPDSDYLMPPIICGYAEHEDILSMEALDKAIDSAMSEAPKP